MFPGGGRRKLVVSVPPLRRKDAEKNAERSRETTNTGMLVFLRRRKQRARSH